MVFFTPISPFLHVCAYVCGMREYVCACLLVCVPEVNVKDLPQLLFMLYIEGDCSLIFLI